MLTFVLVHAVPRALWKHHSVRMESLLWQPGTHSLGTSSCGVRQPMTQVLWALEVPLILVTQGSWVCDADLFLSNRIGLSLMVP